MLSIIGKSSTPKEEPHFLPRMLPPKKRSGLNPVRLREYRLPPILLPSTTEAMLFVGTSTGGLIASGKVRKAKETPAYYGFGRTLRSGEGVPRGARKSDIATAAESDDTLTLSGLRIQK